MQSHPSLPLATMNIMARCGRYGLSFKAIFGKQGFCCGHCRSGHGHGKSCTATLLCKTCNAALMGCQGKWISGEFYCCGHCSGTAGGRHGRTCIFRSLVVGVTEPTDRRSQSPRREMQRSRSSSLLPATQVNEASGSFLVAGGAEHAGRRSRSPRRNMQRSRSSSFLRATQVEATSGSSPSEQLCIICVANPCNMVGIPCGHLVLCQSCSLELRRRSGETNEMLRCVTCWSECTFHRVFTG